MEQFSRLILEPSTIYNAPFTVGFPEAYSVFSDPASILWYHEITNIVKGLKVFGRSNMLKNIIITIIIIIVAVELIEHIIFPIVWYIFKGRKRSTYSGMCMIGKVVEIQRWNKTEGQVLINGELWSAVCEVPLPVGGKALVRGIEGLTLKLKPYENL